MPTELTPFEGRPVTRAAVEIPGVSGGLQAALDVYPEELAIGERRFVLLDTEAAKVRFDPQKPPKGEEDGFEDLTRVHVLKLHGGAGGTIIPPELNAELGDLMEKVREAVRRHQEEADGVLSFPMTGPLPAGTDPDDPDDEASPEAGTDEDGYFDPENAGPDPDPEPADPAAG